MMKIINGILVATAFVISGFFYEQLPGKLPMHWNIRGEVDRYQDKQQAVWFMPLLVLLMWGFFQILPKLDPKKDNYEKFKGEWQWMQAAIIGFFVYLQGVTVYLALNPGMKMLPLMFTGLGVMFVLMGKLMPQIKQNFFVGIKLPWTLTDEENWDKTHNFGGRCFLAAGLLFLGQAVWPVFPAEVIFAGMTGLVFLPVVYSYLIFRQGKKK